MLILTGERLARPAQTIVFYMGLHSIPAIGRELVATRSAGDDRGHWCSRALRATSESIFETLGSMQDLAERETLKPPTIIIVGEVVSLHEKLSWFGMKNKQAAAD